MGENARMPVAKHQINPVIQQTNKVIDYMFKIRISILYVGNEFERAQFLANLFRNHASIKGSSGAMLDDRLHIVNDIYFSKKAGSALTNRLLVEYLTKNAIRCLVIVGLFSEGCVLATAKHAMKTGFEVIVLSDAVAGASDLKRDKAFAKMKSYGAQVIASQEFLNSFSCI